MGVLDFLKNFIYNKATDDQGLSSLWGKKKQQEQPQATVQTQSAQSAGGGFLPPPDYVPTTQIPDETTVTEGPGTKLIQQEDGTVIRVPTDQELPGSTTIQVDDQPPVGEVDYDAIPGTDIKASDKETPVLEKVDKFTQYTNKLNEKDAATLQDLRNKGYTIKGNISRFELKDFLRDYRIGHAPEFEKFGTIQWGGPQKRGIRTVLKRNQTSVPEQTPEVPTVTEEPAPDIQGFPTDVELDIGTEVPQGIPMNEEDIPYWRDKKPQDFPVFAGSRGQL